MRYYNKLHGEQWIYIAFCMLFIVVGCFGVHYGVERLAFDPETCGWAVWIYLYLFSIFGCLAFLLLRHIVRDSYGRAKRKLERRRELQEIDRLFERGAVNVRENDGSTGHCRKTNLRHW